MTKKESDTAEPFSAEHYDVLAERYPNMGHAFRHAASLAREVAQLKSENRHYYDRQQEYARALAAANDEPTITILGAIKSLEETCNAEHARAAEAEAKLARLAASQPVKEGKER